MHASIQTSIRDYLKTTLSQQDYESSLYRTIVIIENYVNNIVDKLAYDQATNLMPHIDASRKQKDLPAVAESILNLSYCNLLTTLPALPNNLIPELEKSLHNIEQFTPKELSNPLRISRSQSLLGDRYRSSCLFEKASKLLQNSRETYEKLSPDSLEAAKTFIRLGVLLRSQGKHDEAKISFLKGIEIYNMYPAEYNPKETFVSLALNERDCGNYSQALDYLRQSLDTVKDKNDPWYFWIRGYMATVYFELGCFKRAVANLSANQIYKAHSESNDVTIPYAWELAQLGSAYSLMKNTKQSFATLEKSLSLFQKLAGKNDLHFLCYKLVYPHLAYNHMLEGEYTIARPLLEISLSKLSNHFGENHPQTIRVRTYLGMLALKEQKMDEAEKLMRKGIAILEPIKHNDIFLPLEGLSDVLYEKHLSLQSKDPALAEVNKKEAKLALIQAKKKLEENFSAESDHLKRVTKKMKKFF